jgi:hypothetical protein
MKCKTVNCFGFLDLDFYPGFNRIVNLNNLSSIYRLTP